MPTIHRWGGYRFFFHSNEGKEPPHVHVARAECRAKFQLGPSVELVWSHGFRRSETTALKKIVVECAQAFTKAWNEHLGRK